MTIRSFSAAEEYLSGGKSKDNRPLENNTRLIRLSPDEIAVRLHDTDVVTYHRNGNIILNSGGWRTPTTKNRITAYSPAIVWSEKGVWWVDNHHAFSEPVLSQKSLFYDGMGITYDGAVMEPRMPDKVAVKAETKLLNAITKYVNAFGEKIKKGIPLPNGGDCWSCYFFDEKAGLTFGDMHGSQTDYQDHLPSHIREKYYVPSLLLNALREKGYRDPMLIFQMENGHGRISYASKRALRDYLKRRLLPNMTGSKPINPNNIKTGSANATRFEVMGEELVLDA